MPTRDPEFVGARIKEARLKQGLRQSAFVGPLVSPGYVSLIEQGKRMPSRKALNHILAVLNMTEAELFKQRDIDFSPQSRATVARADLLITQGDLIGAKKLLDSLPQFAFNLPEVQLVNVELIMAQDPVKALYVLDQQVDNFIRNHQWTHVLRNISLSVRALAQMEQTVEAVVYFARIHRALMAKQDSDAVVVTVVVAELVKRLVEMGDSDGARQVIEESTGSFIDSLDLDKRAEFLLKQSQAAFEASAFEVSIDLSRVAQRLLRGESHLQVDAARDHALSIIGKSVAQLYSGEHKLNRQLQDVIKHQLEFSDADRQRRAAASVALASLLVATNDSDSARGHLEIIDSNLKLVPEMEFEYQLVSAQVAIASGDMDEARLNLGRCVHILESFSTGAKLQHYAHRLAEVYESIGDVDLAFAVIRSGQTRVPNFIDGSDQRTTNSVKNS